jgi:hypothetical protein
MAWLARGDDHVMAVRQQGVGKMATDEAAGAGKQYDQKSSFWMRCVNRFVSGSVKVRSMEPEAIFSIPPHASTTLA